MKDTLWARDKNKKKKKSQEEKEKFEKMFCSLTNLSRESMVDSTANIFSKQSF